MTEERCATCRFVRASQNDKDRRTQWHCHHEPPAVVARMDGGIWSGWPFTSAHDWCGAWKQGKADEA